MYLFLRPVLILGVTLFGMFWPAISISAPESDRIYRLLILDSQTGSPYSEVRRSLLARLAEYGYREGDNLQVSLHLAGNDVKKGEAILRNEIPAGFDVVYVGGTVATISAKRVLYESDQAVVFGSPTDPVGIGVIDGFNQPPRANFTGVSYPVPVKSRFLFLRQLMPQARTFGLIYADMPQSRSYNRWIKNLLQTDPGFKGTRVIFRSVPLVTGEEGDRQMAELAIPIIKELDGQVDAFLKPNDQLGARRHFARTVFAHATKPLIGIVKNDVVADWGATAVVFPDLDSMGRQVAGMIRDLFEGGTVRKIEPKWPARYGYAVDLTKTGRFGIRVPVGILQLAGKNIVK